MELAFWRPSFMFKTEKICRLQINLKLLYYWHRKLMLNGGNLNRKPEGRQKEFGFGKEKRRKGNRKAERENGRETERENGREAEG